MPPGILRPTSERNVGVAVVSNRLTFEKINKVNKNKVKQKISFGWRLLFLPLEGHWKQGASQRERKKEKHRNGEEAARCPHFVLELREQKKKGEASDHQKKGRTRKS